MIDGSKKVAVIERRSRTDCDYDQDLIQREL